jgi:hypothetical protein
VIRREYEEDRVIGLFNFNDKPIKIQTVIEKGCWQKIIGSASEEWGGLGTLVPESILSNRSEVIFVIDAYAFVLYRQSKD